MSVVKTTHKKNSYQKTCHIKTVNYVFTNAFLKWIVKRSLNQFLPPELSLLCIITEFIFVKYTNSLLLTLEKCKPALPLTSRI